MAPQQQHWWAGATDLPSPPAPGSAVPGYFGLPPELREMVLENVDFPIDLGEARKIRAELMAERTTAVVDNNSELESLEYNFCEH